MGLYDGLARAARTPRPLYDARVTTNDDARSERRGRRALASYGCTSLRTTCVRDRFLVLYFVRCTCSLWTNWTCTFTRR